MTAGLDRTFRDAYVDAGGIAGWSLQQGAAEPVEHSSYTYDRSDQLSTAVLAGTPGGGPAHALAYGYDDAGNRTSTAEDGVATLRTANRRNQIFNTGGTTELRGGVTTDASVTLDGRPLALDVHREFRTTVPAHAGRIPTTCAVPRGRTCRARPRRSSCAL